jgi:hypothetical protein
VVSGGCTQSWVQFSISTAVGMRWGGVGKEAVCGVGRMHTELGSVEH